MGFSAKQVQALRRNLDHRHMRGIPVPRDRLQTAAIRGLESDGNSGSHAPDSHASRPRGIPFGSQMSDAIH